MKDYMRYTSKDGATLTMSQWGGSPAELELYRKLAELEDKIENGTLVELPCKVGQKRLKEIVIAKIEHLADIEIRKDSACEKYFDMVLDLLDKELEDNNEKRRK